MAERSISQLSAGTGIWIYESDTAVPYIYLGLDDSGNARVLRRYVDSTRALNPVSNTPSYIGSDLDDYLQSTASDGFLSRFDADTLAAMQNTSISMADYTTNASYDVEYPSTTRFAFLPSKKELGFTNGDLANEPGQSYLSALLTYYQTDNWAAARTTKRNDQVTNADYWTRSGNNKTTHGLINSSGGSNYTNPNSVRGVRPELSFLASTPVSPEGVEEIFLLPASHRAYWAIEAELGLGVCARKPLEGRLIVPNSITGQISFELCDNYNDAQPTWVPCQNGGVAAFGGVKTSADWSLGLRIHAQARGFSEKVYEPLLAVRCEEVSE